MILESSRRRLTFKEGVGFLLADGQYWELPIDPPGADRGASASMRGRPTEAEFQELLIEAQEAESDDEANRYNLAVAIHLLSRNYELEAQELRALLNFPPSSAAADSLMRRVSQLVAEGPSRRRPAEYLRTEASHSWGPRYILQSCWGRLRRGYTGRPA